MNACGVIDAIGVCERTIAYKGMCRTHYDRLRVFGRTDLHNPEGKIPPEQRFWLRVNKSEDCWNWTGSLNVGGYGHWQPTKGTTSMAHRYSYEQIVGPIPEGLVLDHLCRNRSCVNPEHLEPVTQRVNNLRGIGFAATRAAQTHCKWGHEFTLENTYVTKRNQRYCIACRQANSARYRAAARKARATND